MAAGPLGSDQPASRSAVASARRISQAATWEEVGDGAAGKSAVARLPPPKSPRPPQAGAGAGGAAGAGATAAAAAGGRSPMGARTRDEQTRQTLWAKRTFCCYRE